MQIRAGWASARAGWKKSGGVWSAVSDKSQAFDPTKNYVKG